MNKVKVQIDSSWSSVLDHQFKQTYFRELTQFLNDRNTEGVVIYPPDKERFAAFNTTHFDQIKVVILGQDPYHGQGEAHGLCFSVTKGTRIPPSLRNIFKELKADLNLDIPSHGQLTSWAKEGVFLLNTILSVEHKQPASHKNKGWETFTDAVIKTISDKKNHVVFILWGAFAKGKKSLIDTSKHLVLEAPHPAAEVYAGGKAGFFGSKPFSTTNNYLKEQNLSPVNWSIPD